MTDWTKDSKFTHTPPLTNFVPIPGRPGCYDTVEFMYIQAPVADSLELNVQFGSANPPPSVEQSAQSMGVEQHQRHHHHHHHEAKKPTPARRKPAAAPAPTPRRHRQTSRPAAPRRRC